MTNIPIVTNWGTHVTEIFALSDRCHFLAFAKDDYAKECLNLGDPVKITSTADRDYSAILQMFPCHVDDLTSDGTVLAKDSQKKTFQGIRVIITAVLGNNDKVKMMESGLYFRLTARKYQLQESFTAVQAVMMRKSPAQAVEIIDYVYYE